MDLAFGGLIDPSDMEKFRDGPYEQASRSVKEAWKMVMILFLPKLCKGWTKRVRLVLLSEDKETTKEMEALVCWYIDMYGESRWEPEHRENEGKRDAGEKIDRRGKRAGENKKRRQGPLVFVKYLKCVQERRATSKDWDLALQETAMRYSPTEPEGGMEEPETEHTGKRKRQKKAVEPIIPITYRFSDDGEMVPMAEV